MQHESQRVRGAGRAGRLLSLLDAGQCETIHAATLTILERTGVRLEHPGGVELLATAGATAEGDRVRIPRSLVDWALETAPSSVTLYDRRGSPAMVLAGTRTYCGPGSDCMNIVDHRTGQRRQPLLTDVEDAAALCDRLEHIDFVMSGFLPADVDRAVADRHQLRVMLNRTAKPLVFVAYDLSGCEDAVAMGEAVAGGRRALGERPFLACYVNPATGLLHDRDAVAKLLFLAERRIPFVYAPGCIAGVTGPATVAGSVAVINAGMLAGLVLSQLVREGAPVIVRGWGGGGLDARTTVYGYAGPDSRRAATFMAAFYDLPAFGLAGASDAKLVDQQAAAEAALTLAVDTLAGPDMIHDLGYLESGMSGSLTLLTICDQILAWLRRYTEPLDVSEDSLAVGLTDTVGPDGQYLSERHTAAHWRAMWRPALFERERYEGWAAGGATTLVERAARRVDELLAAPNERRLPADVDAALAGIVAAAEREHGSVARP